MGRRIGIVASALGLLVALVVATGALAAGGGTDFTACLSDKGALANVAEGLEPSDPCKKNAHAVTWNSEGPAGIQGPAGIDGAAGDDGTDGVQGPQGERGTAGLDGQDGTDGQDGEACTVADDGEGTITMTCPDASSASWPGSTTTTTSTLPAVVTAVRVLNDGSEWFRIEDSNGDGELGTGDSVVISSLPTGDCATTEESNGTFELTGFLHEDGYPFEDGDGRNYVFTLTGRNIFGALEDRVMAIQVDYSPDGQSEARQSGFAMGVTPLANVQFASAVSTSDNYFGEVFGRFSATEAAPTFGYDTVGSVSCVGGGTISVEELQS